MKILARVKTITNSMIQERFERYDMTYIMGVPIITE